MSRREADRRKGDSLHIELGDGRWLVLTRDIQASARRTREVLTPEELEVYIAALQRLLADEEP